MEGSRQIPQGHTLFPQQPLVCWTTRHTTSFINNQVGLYWYTYYTYSVIYILHLTVTILYNKQCNAIKLASSHFARLYLISLPYYSTSTVQPRKAGKPHTPTSALQESPPPIPPPSSLLHPTLLEKMRLGSPSSAHIQLSTLNRTQSEQAISETLYGLQNTAPFPRLPPYYVHKPTDSDTDQRTRQNRRPRSTSSSAARPPSGRSNASVSFPVRASMSPVKANRASEEQLWAYARQSQSPIQGKG